MAEQVNQRVEDTINELEQMRRTSLYDEDEIKEIARRRSDYEYRIQRHIKNKDDFVHYIENEMFLLQDVARRRAKINLTEKKKDIEYAMANRLNRVFKQFIHRFQNDVDIYCEYFQFCRSVGFHSAASGMIGEMLQMHGDKPKTWLLASKWESEEQNNMEAAKEFLLKGLQRLEDAEILYLELFKIELVLLTFSTEDEEEKEKVLKRADIIWRNGMKNVKDVGILFKFLELVLKYNVEGDLKKSIMEEIWARKDKKEVWPFIAEKELEGCHWKEIEEFAEKYSQYPGVLRNCIGVYEEALAKFPDENLCTKYIHTLLGVSCNDLLKINAVKQAWMSGYKRELLTNDMFSFGLEMLKMEGKTSEAELWKLLNGVTDKQLKLINVWVEKLRLAKPDESKMLELQEEALKVLSEEDAVQLYKILVDNIRSHDTLQALLKKVRNCDNNKIMQIKPRLLFKMYEQKGLKGVRSLYEELITIPPMEMGVKTAMIDIEASQERKDLNRIRQLYEFAIAQHGTTDADIWNDYTEFEITSGTPLNAPPIYQRAMKTLEPKFMADFVAKQIRHSHTNHSQISNYVTEE